MRLQKHVNRKVEGKEYAKYVVVIPPERIEELGWEEGQQLEPQVQGRRLVIFPKPDEREIQRNR
jgi:antitoxin component of MazEF toxin-antitoxin module